MNRIAFTDDVIIKGDVTDVTGLIKFVRDAVCHVDSKKNDHNELKARITFTKIFGRGRFTRGVESSYDDDVAYFFGSQRVYLKRHILRAYDKAVEQLRASLNLQVKKYLRCYD